MGLAASVSPLAIMNHPTRGGVAKFDWLPTECAPKAYPMYLIRGVLQLESGQVAMVPNDRTARNGWGRWGSTHVAGEMVKALPASLDLKWFSWTEDRAYVASFALPTDIMSGWFQRGLNVPRHGRESRFNGVIVGMAPQGLVSVWITAFGETLEVASQHGSETTVAWASVFPHAAMSRSEHVERRVQADLTPEQRAHLERHGVPKGLFESYRQLFRWTPWVTGSEVPSTMTIRSFNGEDAYIGARGPCIPRDTRPVPRMIEIDWTNHRQERRSADVHFNEAEIFAAFRFLSDSQPDAPLQLHLETLADHVDVSLRDQHRRVLLRKTEVTLFKV